MKIKYTGGAGRRVWRPGLEWNAGNNFVNDVARDEALEVLTNPGFEVDVSDPLCGELSLTPDLAAELALAGIFEMADVIELDDSGLEMLVKKLAHAPALIPIVERAMGRD